MNPGRQRAQHHPRGADGGSSLAPGGTALVTTYIEAGRAQVRRFPADASGEGTLLAEGSSPLWSPDGANIAFRDNQSNVAVIPAGGGEPRLLLPRNGDVRSYLLDWSPDGGRLVALTGEDLGSSITYKLETVAVDGSDRRTIGLDGWSPGAMSWSPDGKLFAGSFSKGDQHGIGTVPVGGGTPQIVLPGVGADKIRWSPDGTKLAFGRQYGGAPMGDQGEILVVNADGTDLQRLTTTTGRWENLGDWERLEPTTPPADRDGDGTPDSSDPCPTVAGPCPDPAPSGPTPEQIAAAGKEISQQAARTLNPPHTVRVPATGRLAVGRIDATLLPHGGTVTIDVYAARSALGGATGKRKRIGRVTVQLAEGVGKTLVVRLGAKVRRVLARKGRLKTTIVTKVVEARSGEQATVSRTVTLHRAARR